MYAWSFKGNLLFYLTLIDFIFSSLISFSLMINNLLMYLVICNCFNTVSWMNLIDICVDWYFSSSVNSFTRTGHFKRWLTSSISTQPLRHFISLKWLDLKFSLMSIILERNLNSRKHSEFVNLLLSKYSWVFKFVYSMFLIFDFDFCTSIYCWKAAD